MGDASLLKLVIEKGPREGETLEFRPGSIIRLGRVVRGNSVTIKESGISTKHLTIHFENDLGKWVITDLGSSNGTFLNGTMLIANTPFCLSNYDVVKLGECTSIVVNVCADVPVQRITRRVGLGSVDRKKEGVGEGSEVGLGEEKPKPRGRVRKRKLEGNEGEVVKEMGNDDLKKEEVEEIRNVVSVEVNQGRQLRSRATRNANKEVGGKLGSVVEDFGKQLEGLAAIERKTRKGRGKKKVVEDEVEEKVVEHGAAEKVFEDEADRKVVEDEAEKEVVEERREVKESTMNEIPEVVLDEDVKESTMNEIPEELRVEDVLEQKDVEQKDESSEVKKGNVDLGLEPNLEKMTLGGWFDFLEAYLPKQIHDETEELIVSMKQRARQFHEYSVQQKRAMGKGKSPIP